jgi:hypothetical protein
MKRVRNSNRIKMRCGLERGASSLAMPSLDGKRGFRALALRASGDAPRSSRLNYAHPSSK